MNLSGCLYLGQECRLVIHYEQGFSVLAEPKPRDSENGDEGRPLTPTQKPVLLSYPYEKLRMSSDDGVRMLFLDFGGKEGDIVSVFLYFKQENDTCRCGSGQINLDTSDIVQA